MAGWVLLHRQITDNAIWKDKPFARGQAFIDLVLLANHTSNVIWKRGIKVTLKRGEVGWSQIELAERWGWSRGTVVRFLKFLKTEQMIELETVQQNKKLTTVISITNYDRYQLPGATDDATERASDEQQTVHEQRMKKKGKEKPSAPRGKKHPSPPPNVQGEAVMKIPLCDKTEYGVTAEMVAECQSLFPAVDVMQELRTMRAWCLSNPTNQKTRSGAARFITSWLARSQNRAPKGGPSCRTAEQELQAAL